MSGRVHQSMPFFCSIFHHRGDYIKFPHPLFFLHRSIQSHSTISRSIVYCRKAAIQASPSGPFEIMRVLSPISTSHLFTIYDPFVVPKLFCVHVTLCCAICLYGWSTCATPHCRWYSRYLMWWRALGVATAGRRVAQSVTQCSVPSSGLEGRAVMLYDRHKVKLRF